MVFGLLWRLPLPRPLELYRGHTTGIVVADEFNVGILVQVWVGMEFACDELVDLFCTRTKDVGQATQLRVQRLHASGGDEMVADYVCWSRVGLAQDAGEVEGELFIVG